MIDDFPQHRNHDANREITRSIDENCTEQDCDREELRDDQADELDHQPSPGAVASYRAFARHFSSGAPVYFDENTRFHHAWIIGKTGQGKSTLLKTLALSDIENGAGVFYFDPHGYDFNFLKDCIPPERIKDVVLFDPTADDPISFNPLAGCTVQDAPTVAEWITQGFRDIWHEAYSERMNAQIYHAHVVLLEKPGTTYGDLPLLFYSLTKDDPTELRLRKKWLLKDIVNRATAHFWEYEFPTYPSDAPVAILARIGKLNNSPFAQRVLHRNTTAFTVENAVDAGKIVLVNLPIGIIGETTASILGCLLFSTLRHAIMRRASLLEGSYPAVHLLMDEFQNFTTMGAARTLSEARKFKLSLTLANQFTAQLDPKIVAALKGNVGTTVVFRVGGDDAQDLVRDFDPQSPAALTDLPPHHAWMRQGLITQRITTEPFAPAHTGSTAAVEAHSRKYSRRLF